MPVNANEVVEDASDVLFDGVRGLLYAIGVILAIVFAFVALGFGVDLLERILEVLLNFVQAAKDVV